MLLKAPRIVLAKLFTAPAIGVPIAVVIPVNKVPIAFIAGRIKPPSIDVNSSWVSSVKPSHFSFSFIYFAQ